MELIPNVEKRWNTYLILLSAILVFTLSFYVIAVSSAPTLTAPYPPSTEIPDIAFDWSTHTQSAPGSDNWTITWADDGHQYTTWGDGGGFGGTNDNGRVSLGFARVEGSKNNYSGYNVWGGKDPENPATFTGKSYGILSINEELYMWRCGTGSNSTAYDFQELYKSTDHSATWEFTGVKFTPSSFPGSDGFFCPAFLQFGQDYQGARDNYVYIYAPEIKMNAWAVQKPGEITLIRVLKSNLEDGSQYEYFAGLDGNDNPTWTSNIADRQPVFKDAANGVMRTSINYDAGLNRYFLITEHTERSKGNIGIFDAPEPWGPWTTVLFENGFGLPNIQANTF